MPKKDWPTGPAPTNNVPKAVELTVDLDSFNLETAQGFGTGVLLAQVKICQGGHHVWVHLDLYKHEMRNHPTIRMTVVNRGKDVTRDAAIRPWADSSGRGP